MGFDSTPGSGKERRSELVLKQLNTEEFVSLLKPAERRVRAFIAAIMLQRADIDEVVQNTLVIAWKKLNDFRYKADLPEDEFVRWLCAIARYEALSLLRKRDGKALPFNDSLLDQIVDMQLKDPGYWDQRKEALRICLDKLVASDRALVESVYGGTSVVDVAKHFGKTRQAIYKSLRAIRRKLQLCIKTRLNWGAT